MEEKKDKIVEITEKLEQGIQELFESERYKDYLKMLSKLYHYSFNNLVLIASQRPDATMVAGYTSWKADFHRNVRKGEQGIRILAPAPYKVRKEVEKIDEKTGQPKRDKNGKIETETEEVIIPAYKITTVFDVSQTEGEPLPELVTELKKDVEAYKELFDAIKAVSPVPVEVMNFPGEAKGYFSSLEKKIVIRDGMSGLQSLKTAIHELAHAKLHDPSVETGEKDADRNTKEVQAESVAYTVCQHFGLDTSDYSFGYIAGWSTGRQLDELKKSMNIIRTAAADIISGIEGRLELKEREQEQKKEKEKLPETMEKVEHIKKGRRM